jgi:CubicO group peptidase (beta-lactamase class C family)
MQLVEQGQIDLNADIQTYLDFPIPDTHSAPITMAHLMTHTAGFEEAGLGTFVLERDQKAPLGEYLRNNVPERIYPPGQFAAYSNYGTALAGYIIERVSGMPYEDYIRDYIFNPLEMNHSTLYQPPPGEILQGSLSKGNLRVDGRFQEGRFEYVSGLTRGSPLCISWGHSKFYDRPPPRRPFSKGYTNIARRKPSRRCIPGSFLITLMSMG